MREMRESIEQLVGNADTFSQGYRELKDLLLAEPTLANYYFAHRLLAGLPSNQQVRVALLMSSTTEFVVPLLKTELMLSGIGVEIHLPYYNQFRQEILDSASRFYQFQPGVTIAGFNLEDVFPDLVSRFPELGESERNAAREQVLELYRSLAGAFRRFVQPNAQLFLQNLIPPFGSYDSLKGSEGCLHAFIDDINAQLRTTLHDYRGVHVLDYSRVVSECGAREWTDPRTYYSARISVAQKNWIALAKWYADHVRGVLSAEIKCIVLDLDNTLWGGVLGEDGFDGIRVGDAYPGNVFRRFQEYLLGLYSNGYVLAICSKNNSDDVHEVLRRHPGMVLREHHFAAIRVNWNSKEQNIREISQEIQITCDHMLFVDDNPVEIAAVGAAIPEIACLQLASPPLDFVRQFDGRRCFARLLTTHEDRLRGKQYFEDRQRREFKQTTPSLEDFFRTLSQRLMVHANHRPHAARIAQLTQRTNQFNMTTMRLSEMDVVHLMEQPGVWLLTADLRDRFGDSGTIAYVQIRKLDRTWWIDNWLMSCRVLGRTIEESLMNFVRKKAQHAGAETIIATYVPTKKNAPFRDFYARCGFAETETGPGGEKRYALRLDATVALQEFVEVVELGISV